ncbi:MAG: hypothetical protein LUH07_15510 [Lachnospiraceae bacterium]|nr:hypothetical protein [Lachnospiraceae bacterium]
MSKFSDYLKELIEKRNETIASIARGSGTERTSIHKALNNGRILPYKVVQNLASYLQLSLDERREFFRLYDMLVQGEDVWYNRAAVCELLNQLSAIQFPSDGKAGQDAALSSVSIDIKDGLIEGEYSVQNMLYALLSKEAGLDTDACFQLFLPSGTDLSRTLMQLWHNGLRFNADQIFCFPSAVNTDSPHSVKILQKIIPMSLIARDSYHPYYFYEHSSFLTTSPLSYYIITPHYLVLLSEDHSKAFIQTSERLIKVFSDHFRGLMEYCEPLVSYSTTLQEIMESCSAIINPRGSLYLMPQPCFGHYYTPEMIAKYLRPDNGFTEDMYNAVLQYFSMIQTVKNNFHTIFSEKGLQYFVETGIITELPQDFVLPVDRQDRIRLLSRLRDDITFGRITGRIAHPSSMHIPDYLTLVIDMNGNAWFDTTADFIHGAYYCDIHLSEKSACTAFQDFFQSLPGSQLVYSQEETLQILNKYIQRLKDTQQ